MKPIDFQGRLDRLGANLASAGVDAYVGTRQASLHYLVGAFMPWRGAVVVTSSGEAEVIYWAMDSDRVRQEGWGLEVIEWGLTGSGFVDRLCSRLEERGIAKGRIGLDLFIPGTPHQAPGLLLAHEFMELQRRLPGAELVNGTEYLDNLMVVKGPEEIERLRLANHVADRGFEAALEAIKPGTTENEVAGAIESAIRKNGSIWAWSVTGGTELGSGPRAAFHRGVTQQATDRKITKNEFVIPDIHTMVDLYLGDLALPVYLGNPGVEQQRLIDCWQEVVDFLLSQLRAGVRVASVSENACKIFVRHDLGGFGLPRFGHGLGTCGRLRPFMGPKSPDVLEPGMVLALGTILMKPGVGGLRTEYPLLITETGVEALCETPAKVHVVKV